MTRTASWAAAGEQDYGRKGRGGFPSFTRFSLLLAVGMRGKSANASPSNGEPASPAFLMEGVCERGAGFHSHSPAVGRDRPGGGQWTSRRR